MAIDISGLDKLIINLKKSFYCVNLANCLQKDFSRTHQQHQEQQKAKHLQSGIFSFMVKYQLGTLHNFSGIRKLKGVSPLMLFFAIFQLPFEGNNFTEESTSRPPVPF